MIDASFHTSHFLGGLMLYTELANVPLLKEAFCRIINGRHHGAWTEPCY